LISYTQAQVEIALLSGESIQDMIRQHGAQAVEKAMKELGLKL
jgi:hypothetical protein